MMKPILLLLICSGMLLAVSAQPVRLPPDTIPAGSVLLADYEGRTPCQELAADLHLNAGAQCAKRKLALTLFVDSVTRQPTVYKVRGMGMYSGTGKWQIEKGMPGNPQAIVYRLKMGSVSMLLMKGDEQVLFVLDKHKNFLAGNAQYSYTMNRVLNKRVSWLKWRELAHRGESF